jgi:hypothetical protein
MSGVWALLPAGTRRRHYKKYTRIMDVTVTPQMAAALKSFGGVPVQGILRDQLALPAGQAVTARVHLYEALAGSTLPDIAMHEKSVRGLGSSRRESWSLIHPLTPEAASILFKEPGLGRQVDPRFLADRNHITVGQRFYYLEIAGARPRLIASGAARRAARVSQTSLVIDFPKSTVRIFLFFSEAEAQALSAQLRGRAPIGTLLTTLKAGLDARLQALLSGVPTRSVRIIHEAVPAEHFSSPIVGAAVRLVGRPLRGLLIRWVLEALRRELEQRSEQFAAQFTRAAAAEADGVTVTIEFRQPSFMAPLRGLLSRRALQVSPIPSGGLFRQAVGDFAITIHPGFVRS